MTALSRLHDAIFGPLERADWLLPTLARFLFAAVLAVYFWVSGMTKLGDGIFGIFQPSLGAYAQIFPKVMENVGYDVTQLGFYHWAVVTAGTVAEFVLPLLIIIGLLTRLASLGMIGFIVVQSLTDLNGHGKWDDALVLGAWFDAPSNSLIMDQRALWVFLLLLLVVKGAGPISFDRALAPKPAPAAA
ncbi:DoxX family membrane protein [Tateyamaria sp. syn59]|uniref:DoxX family membrane protein n=1 Tax=Tateyamaria sp. syn59 TaxID=2576942 RepID=UPI0011BE4707|nr:DoxX family membrane protein [Tateyamaria sp. syn59]